MAGYAQETLERHGQEIAWISYAFHVAHTEHQRLQIEIRAANEKILRAEAEITRLNSELERQKRETHHAHQERSHDVENSEELDFSSSQWKLESTPSI